MSSRAAPLPPAARHKMTRAEAIEAMQPLARAARWGNRVIVAHAWRVSGDRPGLPCRVGVRETCWPGQSIQCYSNIEYGMGWDYETAVEEALSKIAARESSK